MQEEESESVETIIYRPIGVIHSPFREPKNMPIQPAAAKGAEGSVEIRPDLIDGLKDLEGFSHLVLIYHLHLSQGFSLLVKPFLDDELRGVFATRAPRRPNAIGLSVVRLVAIDSATLQIRDVDIVDETPLLDLKPYIPEANSKGSYSLGWLASKTWMLTSTRSDDRFED